MSPLPHSEWFAILEPVAAAYLAELGIERDPEMHALTQIERLASIRRNHDIAVEWGKRGKAALGVAWYSVDAIQPPRFASLSVMLHAPALPKVPKAFYRNRPPVPTSSVQVESAHAQLAAWEASGQTLAETERLAWWVHPSDFETLREALVGPRLLGLLVTIAQGGESWPTVKATATATGASEATVYNWRRRARERLAQLAGEVEGA